MISAFKRMETLKNCVFWSRKKEKGRKRGVTKIEREDGGNKID